MVVHNYFGNYDTTLILKYRRIGNNLIWDGFGIRKKIV